MKKTQKNENKVLIKELEDHAKKEKLLKQVIKVAKKIKNIEIYKNKYLIIKD